MSVRPHPLLLACALALPGLAMANTVVVAPLIGTDVKATRNVTDLMASELDFMPAVEDVVQLDAAPGNLNASCLNSSSCLGGITRSAGGDKLVTGTLTTTSATFTLDLVLYDSASNKVVRRKQFTMPAEPEKVADGMTGVMRELMTGDSPAKAQAAEPTVADFSIDDDDDFAFEPDNGNSERMKPAPMDLDDMDLSGFEEEETEEERRRAEAEARRQADEQERRRAEEERRRQEELARQKAAEEERRRADEERRRQEELARQRAAEEDRRRAEQARRDQEAVAAADEEEEFDPSMISFGSASDEIEVEEVEEAIQFAPSSPSRASSSSSSRSSERSAYYDDEEEIDLAALDEDDRPSRSRSTSRYEDEDEEDSRSSRSSSSSSSRGGSSARTTVDRGDEGPSAVQIAVRGGYSKYYTFNFITAGAEASIGLGPSVYLLAGLETYSVQRTIPPALQVDGRASEWNTIYPLNVGVVYKGGSGAVKPYVGADLITVPYYFDENNQPSWAIGGRGRAGADLMVSPSFGFNANVAAGFWQGKDWVIIQRDVGESGLLPQVSLGTVLAF